MKMNINDTDLLDERALYRISESNANQFNLRCLLVLAGFSVLCELLNNLGIFVVSKDTMHICSALGLMAFLFPVLLWYIHDIIMERPNSLTEWGGLKYLILASMYVGVCIYCVMLTFHGVVLLALPAVSAAQYSDQRRLLFWSLLGGILVVIIGVFGGFYLGIPDRNFFKDITTPDNLMTLDYRIRVGTGRQLAELFAYFALPRIFGVISINIMVSGIARRNGFMLSRQAALAEQINQEMQRRNATFTRVIDDLATLIENRDLKTGEHVEHTKLYVGRLARMLRDDASYPEEVTDQDIIEMETAAPLHDIGKIAISDTILLKPGKLTPEEFEEIKTHTTKGGEMIRKIFSDLDYSHIFQVAEDIVVCHHEKWDGSGYPEGLKGTEIPLAARIMAIADVYDAQISERPYKKAMAPEEALQIIYSESGTHFDPEIIRVMRKQGS